MAIETGAIYKSLTFGGIDSRTYGVYITGAGVFNSPERDVEMISIPGRDGAFALDNGRYSNMEVTYPAGLFGVDPADFADAISDFRNAIGSLVGYQRLEDGYNPGEYRQAVFKAGLEVEPTNLEAGEFSITFDCKPQRWLKSGEAAIAITSGDDLTNPTLMDASPLLQVWGYGKVDLGGAVVEMQNTTIGTIYLYNYDNDNTTDGAKTYPIDTSLFNNGDALTVGAPRYALTMKLASGQTFASYSTPTVTGDAVVGLNVQITSQDTMTIRFGYSGAPTVNNIGAGTTVSKSSTITVPITLTGGTSVQCIIQAGLAYNDSLAYISASNAIKNTSSILPYLQEHQNTASHTYIVGNSTKTAVGSPVYIDLDLGEAWNYDNGEAVSVNNAVSIPAQLPTLAPGNNAITYDNTISQLKIVPRWWKL